MDFFSALVRYEVALWTAVDQELGRQGQLSMGQLHALRIVSYLPATTRAAKTRKPSWRRLPPGRLEPR